MTKRVILWMLSILLLLGPVPAQATQESATHRILEMIAAGAEALPEPAVRAPITNILTVREGRLWDADREVILNGVNLGGWLLMESWMIPVLDPEEALADDSIFALLSQRFGKKDAKELQTLYRDSFLTETDFARIAALGFNCVRIPFSYRNFMTESGVWLTTTHAQNPGFQRLDWAIAQCEKNGLYAVLDMHGCPGGQSANHSTGSIGQWELFQEESHQNAMERLWSVIASRYRSNPHIAAYDIMNEPQNNAGFDLPQAESEEAVALTNRVYDRMIRAIRKKDTRHIITVEGIWSMDTLPNPKEMGWERMMYQLHIYDRNLEGLEKRMNELLRARDQWGVAVYVGEYNSGSLESVAAALYDRHSISRTKWTYKTVGREGDNWGLFNKSMEKVNLKTASLQELRQVFGKEMQTENGFVLNQEEYQAIQ